MLSLTDEHCISLKDWEENDNIEAGGDCSGKGMAAGSTFKETQT